MFPNYDVIVVGGGHSGCEAAVAAANMGSSVLLVTMNMNTIAQMSCNPAIGGIAKGQIVREIDAMNGYTGIVTDHSMIQFRMLNRSKGPAMWSPRAQSDRMAFAGKWRQMLENHPLIDFWQEMVTGLIVKEGRIYGVKTSLGLEIPGKTVILTNGTFLNGLIHIGAKKLGGGRAGEGASKGITAQLQELGFESGRMKTGTPPRVDGRSLHWDRMEIQPGDEDPGRFSFTNTPPLENQIPCHITYTSSEVHEELKKGFKDSPMFSGRIQGIGPRYCPSIEDKINRFSHRDRHQLFIEPEGRHTCEVYVNGFSSSLPEDIQYKALKKIQGFEDVKMFRPGYAIEYDFFPPQQLNLNLETKLISNLFFAGQINGTTGYEEAGSQGLIAGINAHLKIREEEPFILTRYESYIGVLIDDLVNKGTDEPYRMFTSRAEFRILLRQDDADIRLTPKVAALGMNGMDKRLANTHRKIDAINRIETFARDFSVEPGLINPFLETIGSSTLSQKIKLETLILRPNVHFENIRPYLRPLDEFLKPLDEESINSAEIEMKYSGYIQKEQEQANKHKRLEEVTLGQEIDYKKISSLSTEGREKLLAAQPMNIGQASRISGVSPADISVLLVHMGR